jgi:hypothetical protein
MWCQYGGIQKGVIVVSYLQGGITMAILKTRFTLRLDLEDHAKIKKIAEKQNRSMTNMIETVIKQTINKYEEENGEIKLTEEDLSIE